MLWAMPQWLSCRGLCRHSRPLYARWIRVDDFDLKVGVKYTLLIGNCSTTITTFTYRKHCRKIPISSGLSSFSCHNVGMTSMLSWLKTLIPAFNVKTNRRFHPFEPDSLTWFHLYATTPRYYARHIKFFFKNLSNALYPLLHASKHLRCLPQRRVIASAQSQCPQRTLGSIICGPVGPT